MSDTEQTLFSKRFRGFFPVVIDVETAGFNKDTDALLEIAVTMLKMDDDGILGLDQTVHFHVEPFEGANIEQSAIEFNGIDPHSHCVALWPKAMPSKKSVKQSERHKKQQVVLALWWSRTMPHLTMAF